ncbi:heme NO-binding domain-containing protein [Marinibactrum halimedae]|uniref:Guanylate cyclase n=1 Tax=Marinibactrum halimedae TaxID=1444977 RepID=A0AA37WMB3_9GAMM|nr:heme NO-binding domain-containing protein [Marinibactrum halimedae]MCD9457840.1 heme NO-binding domain-containing protein [Marinibactrum halimedae]GLS24786.1 guanylate cyclase [Marinibactrum halimedae]
MLGHIFTILEKMIVTQYGLKFWNEVIRETELPNQGAFTTGGLYPDEYMLNILSVLVKKIGIPLPDLLRAYGHYMFEPLFSIHPKIVEHYKTAKELLMNIDVRIHHEVAMYHKEAALPLFTCKDTGKNTMIMYYQSERRLCYLVEGLLKGIAEHFSTSIEFTHSTCMHKGDDQCTFNLVFKDL